MGDRISVILNKNPEVREAPEDLVALYKSNSNDSKELLTKFFSDFDDNHNQLKICYFKTTD